MNRNADTSDEVFLLELLNSSPVVDGTTRDLLAGPSARRWLRERGGTGSTAERDATTRARDALQDVVRGRADVTVLAPVLDGARSVPTIDHAGVCWTSEVPQVRRLAVRAVLAWDAVHRNSPGRLRPCANEDCALFLIDHSRPNRARWCSMAACGNRMKARRHYERSRSSA